jgi:serine/threonine-protein kinase
MSLTPGARLGPYEIEAAIGSGGMGEVYRARDNRLGREVAIKVLPADGATDAERRARFEREARVVASLSHPNVLALYEFGSDADRTFVVTELLIGETLRERLSCGPLAVQEVLDYGSQIAKGLAAAHKRGVVHRDLKPENVFVTADGIVKILDFGLARHHVMTESSGIDTSFRSQPGLVLGTAAYMSPEQVRGEPADARSDIFALGALLHELLGGRPAFKRDTAAETMRAVLKEDPGDPGAPVTSAVVATLERVVRRCLEKRPEDRVQSAGDLALYFESLLHGSLTDRTPGAEAAPPGRRRLRLLTAAMITLAVVAVYVNRSAVGSLLVARLPVRSLAVVSESQPGAPASVDYVSRRLVDSITDRLSQVPGLEVIASTQTRRFSNQPLDVLQLKKAVGADAVVTVGVSQSGQGYEVRVGMVDAGRGRHLWGRSYAHPSADVADLVDGISNDVTESLQLRLNAADRSRLEAYSLYQKGRYYWSKRNAEGLREAVGLFTEVTRLDPRHALAYAGLANAQSLLSYYGGVSSADSFPKAKVAAEKALELDETLAEAHTALALVLRDYERAWLPAEREFKRAIELDPRNFTAHQWYAEYLAAMGRSDEAIRFIRRAEELAPLEPVVAAVHGWVYYLARRPDDAIAQLLKTTEREPAFAVAHWFLALAYAQSGQLAEAVASCERAVDLDGGSPRMTAYLAAINAKSGKRRVAMELLQRLEEVRRAGGYVSPYDLAVVHVALGNHDKAFALLDRAIADRRWELVNLKVDWMLDPIRNDPRYSVLVQRMGLPD